MFRCQRDKFWLERLPNLFCSTSLVPLDGMSLEDQMNSLTRLTLIIFLVLVLFRVKNSILFLILALLFIIILYYIQKKQMETFRAEHYKPPQNQAKPQSQGRFGLQIVGNRGPVVFNNPNDSRYCNDYVNLDGGMNSGVFNNQNYMSINQRLAGGPNPRTKIPPVIVPPAADLSYWGANNLVSFPQINEESNLDVYRSGYQVSTCCPGIYNDRLRVPVGNDTPSKSKRSRCNNRNCKCINCECGECRCNGNVRVEETMSGNTEEDYKYPYMKTQPEQDPDEPIFVRDNQSGQVNVNCGYNPSQLYTAGLPTNLAVGNCTKDPAMKDYNENLFTQIIQPGVYSYNQVNEPISSNIGISFQQQFEPTTKEVNKWTGETMYTEHDPRIMEPIEECVRPESINESNVYDPRFTGYGTSYRSYTDDKIGQTKFYYDDINAIRMPNYVVRSNIDNQPFADQYGPVQDAYGNPLNSDIRALANDAFTRSAIDFRTDLQERLMRKQNANAWQQKVAPINTYGQRMLGGRRM